MDIIYWIAAVATGTLSVSCLMLSFNAYREKLHDGTMTAMLVLAVVFGGGTVIIVQQGYHRDDMEELRGVCEMEYGGHWVDEACYKDKIEIRR